MTRELSLFSGAGGGLLGTYLLGWEPIGYVEYDDYCQRVIRQRIDDGILPNAPIYGDIRTFISEGYAASYTGMVDVLTGGFPCQPFSVAGKRAGADDARNMWPATAECVRIIRPRYCFFENVPGILSSGYFGRIIADLAACGYGVRWRVLSAAEVGAPHKRDRLWIVAYAGSAGTGLDDRRDGRSSGQGRQSTGARQPTILRQEDGAHRAEGLDAGNADVPDAKSQQDRRLQQRTISAYIGASCQGADVADATINGLEEGRQTSWIRPDGSATSSWWETERGLGRLADGIPKRVDRLKAAGNAQVPLVAATAWRLLTEGLDA